MKGRVQRWRRGKHTIRCLSTQQYKGFSLVELLVTIAIVATLVGILLPAVGGYREKTRLLQCSNNLRQLQLTARMYVDTYRMLPVLVDMPGTRAAWDLPESTYRCPAERSGFVMSYGYAALFQMMDYSVDPPVFGGPQFAQPRYDRDESLILYYEYFPNHQSRKRYNQISYGGKISFR